MEKVKFAFLEFDPALNRIDDKKQLRDGLSVSVKIGDTLWVANDETVSLECLTLKAQYPVNFFLEIMQNLT